MNYFPDFMALAEIALIGGAVLIIFLFFFAAGSKARREHHQRALEIEKLQLRVAFLKMDLKECEDYERWPELEDEDNRTLLEQIASDDEQD